ncbi:hypothetical protein KCU81_g155, partial [Aureobasidium melanogenum]
MHELRLYQRAKTCDLLHLDANRAPEKGGVKKLVLQRPANQFLKKCFLLLIPRGSRPECCIRASFRLTLSTLLLEAKGSVPEPQKVPE